MTLWQKNQIQHAKSIDGMTNCCYHGEAWLNVVSMASTWLNVVTMASTWSMLMGIGLCSSRTATRSTKSWSMSKMPSCISMPQRCTAADINSCHTMLHPTIALVMSSRPSVFHYQFPPLYVNMAYKMYRSVQCPMPTVDEKWFNTCIKQLRPRLAIQTTTTTKSLKQTN